jgi:hypothetical protein
MVISRIQYACYSNTIDIILIVLLYTIFPLQQHYYKFSFHFNYFNEILHTNLLFAYN